MSNQKQSTANIDTTLPPPTNMKPSAVTSLTALEDTLNGPSTQTLDESSLISTPSILKQQSPITIVSDTDNDNDNVFDQVVVAATTTTTTPSTTPPTSVTVENDTNIQPPYQPDDLVCIGNVVGSNTTTTTTTDLSPLTTNTNLTSTLLPIASPQHQPISVSSSSTPQQQPQEIKLDVVPIISTQSTTSTATTTTTTTTTPSMPAILTATRPILRASLGGASKRSLPLNTLIDDEVNKRQRGVNGLVTSTTTTQPSNATTTTTATTTTQNNNSRLGSSATQQSSTAKILVAQFKELSRDPPAGINVEIEQNNIHRWKITMIGPSGTPYEGGIFPCTMVFPQNYPASPPSFAFDMPNFPHPNVFADGKVCISILHDANDSNYDHEPPSERWKPILGVEAILLSVMSLLTEPNTNSPANVEMSKLYKENTREYHKRIIMAVRRSQGQ
jgi:ubiquitin-protein ligase